MQLTLSRKALILVMVPLLFELGFIATLYGLLNQIEQEKARETHAREVASHVSSMLRLVLDQTLRGVTLSVTKQMGIQDGLNRLNMKDLGHKVTFEMETLQVLTADRKDEREKMEELDGLQQQIGVSWKAVRDHVDSGDKAGALIELMRTRKLEDQLTRVMDKLIEEQEFVEQVQARSQENQRRQVELLLAVVVVFNIILAFYLAYNFNKGTTRRLGILMDNTRRLAAGQPLNPPLKGGDEIAHLDRTFNEMVGQLKAAARQESAAREEVERMRQEFISMVSHDLRSPLGSVQGFLELVSEGVCGTLNESGKKKLASADRSIMHMLNLIKDLLDSERARAGKLALNIRSISMAHLISRSIDAVHIQSEQLGIEITSDVSDAQVLADEERIVQVIINLLSNAIKFSSEKSTVTIKTFSQDNWAEIRVTDSGTGIPPEDQERIFERFEQAQGSDNNYKGGTGLGLAICKSILDRHGGSIGVESQVGKGSSFWFRLPLATADAMQEGNRAGV